MAKTYLEVNPSASLLILDSSASVGGVWAKERLYPGLKTNNLLGTYESSDFPMTPEQFDVAPGQHISGDTVHDYLTQFSDHFGLTCRIRLGHKLESAELLENGEWFLRIVLMACKTSHRSFENITAGKLVVATGLTSEPFVPRFSGQTEFNRVLFHSKELRHHADDLDGAKHVVVLGGNKSAWDACFLIAKKGVHAHMVIRPEGGGPSWVWPVRFSPFKVSVQRLAATRFFTWFDPCIWSERSGLIGWIRCALHRTWIGQRLVSGFWNALAYFPRSIFQYDKHPETQKLEPWVSPFWMGNSLGIHNYETSWFELVRAGKITVHIDTISRLSEGAVHLSSNEVLEADALVCCTGWDQQPFLKFFPKNTAEALGLLGLNAGELKYMEQARSEIFGQIPALQHPPPRVAQLDSALANEEKRASHRYNLYRFLVPPSSDVIHHRNIAFIGAQLSLHTVMIAQLQALWITAFFMNEIEDLKQENISYTKVRHETTLHNEYTRIRHPPAAGGAGERCPDLVFDCLSYMDLLMDDLKLDKHRKYRKGEFWPEIFHRYGPSDYKGIVNEWLHKFQAQG
jgi:hypothetical protein